MPGSPCSMRSWSAVAGSSTPRLSTPDGAAERLIGLWLRARPVAAREVLVLTKGAHPDEAWRSRLTPEAIAVDIAASLGRLGVGAVDAWLVHRDDEAVPVGEIVDALDALVRTGQARSVGVSNWRLPRLREAVAWAAAHGPGPDRRQQQLPGPRRGDRVPVAGLPERPRRRDPRLARRERPAPAGLVLASERLLRSDLRPRDGEPGPRLLLPVRREPRAQGAGHGARGAPGLGRRPGGARVGPLGALGTVRGVRGARRGRHRPGVGRPRDAAHTRASAPGWTPAMEAAADISDEAAARLSSGNLALRAHRALVGRGQPP